MSVLGFHLIFIRSRAGRFGFERFGIPGLRSPPLAELFQMKMRDPTDSPRMRLSGQGAMREHPLGADSGRNDAGCLLARGARLRRTRRRAQAAAQTVPGVQSPPARRQAVCSHCMLVRTAQRAGPTKSPAARVFPSSLAGRDGFWGAQPATLWLATIRSSLRD
jgi:hypothetical protein